MYFNKLKNIIRLFWEITEHIPDMDVGYGKWKKKGEVSKVENWYYYEIHCLWEQGAFSKWRRGSLPHGYWIYF